jgi:hypothetical protein
MRLSPTAHAELESFFREYRGDVGLRLPAVAVHGGPLARLLTFLAGRMGAVTLGRHVFVSPRLLGRNAAGRRTVPGWLLAHEAAHVLQYAERGRLRFLRDYLWGFFRALWRGRRISRAARTAAYLAIAEECEARAVEEAFRLRRAGSRAVEP